MIDRFAEAYHLPASANWIGDETSRTLRCKGFEVRISNSNGGEAVITEAGKAWVAEQKKRWEAFDEQLRRDFKP